MSVILHFFKNSQIFQLTPICYQSIQSHGYIVKRLSLSSLQVAQHLSVDYVLSVDSVGDTNF